MIGKQCLHDLGGMSKEMALFTLHYDVPKLPL